MVKINKALHKVSDRPVFASRSNHLQSQSAETFQELVAACNALSTIVARPTLFLRYGFDDFRHIPSGNFGLRKSFSLNASKSAT
jgi:hypothetical protein